MDRFRNKYMPKDAEEESYYFIKELLRDYEEDGDFYARGGSSSGGGDGSSSRRTGGSSSSYHEDREAKLEALWKVYEVLSDFFEEIEFESKQMSDQPRRRRRR